MSGQLDSSVSGRLITTARSGIGIFNMRLAFLFPGCFSLHHARSMEFSHVHLDAYAAMKSERDTDFI